MSSILFSFRSAFGALFRWRMLLLILAPSFVAMILVLLLFIIFWPNWVLGLSSFFSGMSLFQWVQNQTGFLELASWTAVLFLIMAFIPVAFLLAVILTSLFVMPVLLKWVSDEDFKDLEKKRGGSLAGSVWNTVVATVLFCMAFVVTLPLWLVPGCQVLVPLLLTAWLNKRVFMYDVLQDYATKEERQQIEKEEGHTLFGMGMLLGLLSYIPLAFFLVPVLSGLSYTYYGLSSLRRLRKQET
ncbi:EI24 domain-containing protein [Bdellovibrio sp. 22V]|uniref:EI24 domain-containing protein n=1 Tax=Bdellovibrio TaxID=958 RepID=UPI002542DD42|nr:EI24 domain-containing protein [Bdellovibrio sp. 22V]WII71862.1 EI24 domain-containing protein [Bdellovibrio sp. 22V]